MTFCFQNAHGTFRLTLAESASYLKLLYDKLGKKVDQARPYYEALHQTNHVRSIVIGFILYYNT